MMRDSQLGEHCSLIPIETLAGHFAGLELNDTHESELGFSTGGRHARKHPIHVKRMGKANHELLDDPVVAEGLRQRGEFEIRWDFRQKLIGVELTHARPAGPTGPGRNGEHIGVLGHRDEGCIGIFEHEFGMGVLLPRGQHSLLVRCEVIHRKFLSIGTRSDEGEAGIVSERPSVILGVSGERGPVASNANSEGSGYGVGSGTGSMGKLEDLQYLLYFRTVQQKVKDAWTFPGGSNDLKADVEFSIGADGTLNGVKIAKSSGDSAFDESVLRAIRRAAPFPPPPDRYRAQFSDVVSTFKLGELKS